MLLNASRDHCGRETYVAERFCGLITASRKPDGFHRHILFQRTILEEYLPQTFRVEEWRQNPSQAQNHDNACGVRRHGHSGSGTALFTSRNRVFTSPDYCGALTVNIMSMMSFHRLLLFYSVAMVRLP